MDTNNKFDGNLGSYIPVKTEDGSITLHSQAFDENCHSTAGAQRETYYNYVEGCQLLDLFRTQEQMTVFEVGFGAGVGALCTFEWAHKHRYQKRFTFISSELDPALVEWAKKNQLPMPATAPSWEQLVPGQYNGQDCLRGEKAGKELIILIGDVRQSVTAINDHSIDAIYQDPFSPRQNPSLWTKEWFTQLARMAKSNAIMSTYSASSRVRKSMEVAGFQVYNRQGFGPKRSCTIASKSPLNYELVQLSPKILPLLDSEL